MTSPETDLKNLKDYKRMIIDYSLKGTIDKFRGKIRDKMKAYLLLLHLLDKRSLYRFKDLETFRNRKNLDYDTVISLFNYRLEKEIAQSYEQIE